MSDTSNKFGVGARGDGTISFALTPSRLSHDDAILLAAWLCVMARDDGSKVLELMASIKGQG